MSIMSKDEIRSEIERRRLWGQTTPPPGMSTTPSTFNALADAVGVERSTMRAALAPNGTLSKGIAEKVTAYLRPAQP